MKLRKRLNDDGGYLLLENMLAVSTVSILLMMVYPLISDWIVERKEVKDEVEQARVLYECSMDWPETVSTDADYPIQSNAAKLAVGSTEQMMDVTIYAIEFE